MRGAVACEPGDGRVPERTAKFVEQPGLANASLSHDAHGLPVSRLHAGQTLVQLRQLALASDEGGQPAFGIDLQAAAPTLPAGDLINDNRLVLAFDVDWPQRIRLDISLNEAIGRIGDQNRSRLGHGL